MNNFSDFHTVKDLKFDVKKLREGLKQVLKIKNYDDANGIKNFAAICLNQIPGDPDSLKGENVKVILDLLHLVPGTYDIEPSVIVSGPDVIKTDTILPAFIRVIINEPTNVSDD